MVAFGKLVLPIRNAAVQQGKIAFFVLVFAVR